MGECGSIQEIVCRAGKGFAIVSDAELQVVEGSDVLSSVNVPNNCPRTLEFDQAERLGCLACVHSHTKFIDSRVAVGIQPD